MRAWQLVVAVLLATGQVAWPWGIQTYSERIGPCWVLQVHDGDSISVRLPQGEVIAVRYLGIDAPDEGPISQLAWDRNRELVEGKEVELVVATLGGTYLTDRDGRWLACVFTPGWPTEPVQVLLLREGLARLDLWEVRDDFRLWHEQMFLRGQLVAARERLGLWKLPDFCGNQDFIIAAIKFWGDTEEVYLLNRGEAALELAEAWALVDEGAQERWERGENPRNSIAFEAAFGPTCSLLPGGVLVIRTGPGVPPGDRRTPPQGCGTQQVVLNWFGNQIWNNDGDIAYLYAPGPTLVCTYRYPWRTRSEN